MRFSNGEILGRWEIDRGPEEKHYEFWWNLPRDYMVSSECALPPHLENGLVPEELLSNKYGHRLHFWDLRARCNVKTIELGANHQMALEVRPAHDPIRAYGFVGVVVDTTNPGGSIWTWWREGGKFHAEKTTTIPPGSAPKDQLPPLLQGLGAVRPLVTDIDLLLVDKFLYVSWWEPVRCVNTTRRSPASRHSRDRSTSGASHDGSRIRTEGLTRVDRRWSRSAATESERIGPTRSIRLGTTSSAWTASLRRR